MRTVNLQFRGYDPLNGEEWSAMEEAVVVTDRVAVTSNEWGDVRFFIFRQPIEGNAADADRADTISMHLHGFELTPETAALIFHDFARYVE